MNIDPARLKERVRFEPRLVQAPDNLGNTRGEWDEAAGFERWAQFIMRAGSDAVVDARLQGMQPVDAILRYDRQTATIQAGWRMKHLSTGIVYAVTAAADMDPARARQWWTVTAVAGKRP